MRIECPWCGLRNENEFSYGGDASRQRPSDNGSTEEWADFVYLRQNQAGLHQEFWQHVSGCRAWIRVERDTISHKIISSTPASAVFENHSSRKNNQAS